MNYELFILINTTMLISSSLDIFTNMYCLKNDFFKQFTIWNLISMCLKPYHKQVIINNITICILFHFMFIIDPILIYKIPKRCGVSFLCFNLLNVILHIIPLVYSILFIKKNIIIINYIDILNNLFYFLVWSIYMKFDYSIYSIENCYYKYIFLMYFACLIGYSRGFRIGM